MKKLFISIFVVSLVAGWVGNSYAESQMTKKLKRGSVNILTAPVEIPKQFRSYWIQGSEKTPHIIVWLIAGTVKGVANAVGRVGSGVFDILTCNVENPKVAESLFQPEYVGQEWPTRDSVAK